jgi:hypothetical protein
LIENGAEPAVCLAGGERLAARQLVIAAGPEAAGLLRPLGWRVPISAGARPFADTSAGDRGAAGEHHRRVAQTGVLPPGREDADRGPADVGFAGAAVDPPRLAAMTAAARDSLPRAADYDARGEPGRG